MHAYALISMLTGNLENGRRSQSGTQNRHPQPGQDRTLDTWALSKDPQHNLAGISGQCRQLELSANQSLNR
jgi:hypothetical protein